ncbi:MAG: Kelch repeat type 1-containing protein [Adhaeribacter sp.]|nr:Kelch repeat type 1-containing protein [Adhaeribacter sp.]
MKKSVTLTCLLISFLSLSFYAKEPLQWRLLSAKNEAIARSENSFASVGDKLYLLGGRNKLVPEAYDIKTQTWAKGADAPLEMHHFQAVTYKDEIYVVGALTGPYPHETPIPRIYIYNPKINKWRSGDDIPAARRRGSAGALVYQNKIYLVGGITDGHWDGHVTWFDEYDPATGKWRQLPDAPRARDHVSVAMANGQMVVAGGRLSTARIGKVLDLTVPEVDIFDFKSNKWRTLPAAQNIPTMRAGNSAVALGSKILIIGGESPQKLAHNQTEAFDVKSQTWSTLAPLQTGRHGTGAAVYKNKVYTAAGSANQGGGPEINTIEVLE